MDLKFLFPYVLIINSIILMLKYKFLSTKGVLTRTVIISKL